MPPSIILQLNTKTLLSITLVTKSLPKRGLSCVISNQYSSNGFGVKPFANKITSTKQYLRNFNFMLLEMAKTAISKWKNR